MTIRSNLNFGTQALTVTDNLVVDFTALNIQRYNITVCSLHNTTAAAITVSFYSSPDATSASGVKIADYFVSATAGNNQIDVNALMGQGYTQNIIAVPDAVGCNIDISGNTYDAND